MKKGLQIYAKINTTERAVVFINPNENNLQALLNEKYGDGWVLVNELCLGDILLFESEIYKGFDNRENDNYCQPNLIKNP